MTHHSIMSYQERLITHMTSVARQPPSARLSDLALSQETASANMTSLFAPPVQNRSAASGGMNEEALDAIGKALGSAAQVSDAHCTEQVRSTCAAVHESAGCLGAASGLTVPLP